MVFLNTARDSPRKLSSVAIDDSPKEHIRLVLLIVIKLHFKTSSLLGKQNMLKYSNMLSLSFTCYREYMPNLALNAKTVIPAGTPEVSY